MEDYFDHEVNNPDNYKLTIFYFNPSDSRAVVPKRRRFLGWTLNFGNYKTYLLLLIVAVIILGSRYLLH